MNVVQDVLEVTTDAVGIVASYANELFIGVVIACFILMWIISSMATSKLSLKR